MRIYHEGPQQCEIHVTGVTAIQSRATRLTSRVYSLKEGVDSFYEYMLLLTCHEVSPLVVSPSDLRNILLEVKTEICSHPRLESSDGPDVNIWAYYSIM